MSTPQLNPAQIKFKKRVENWFLFKLFMFMKLPAAWIAGLKLKQLDNQTCKISVPFKWLNQNPFKSTYFAVLAMAAEMSTGLPALLAIQGAKPPMSMLVVGLRAEFIKKAVTVTTFECKNVPEIFAAVEKAKATGEGVPVEATTIGYSKKGEEVAKFYITWSFKQKKAR